MAGWGGAVALVGGIVAYLWLASDSIMDELKEQRPQITIAVKPKRRSVPQAAEQSAAAQSSEERTSEEPQQAETPNPESGRPPTEGSETTDAPAPDSGTASGDSAADLKAGLSRVLAPKMNPHPDLKLIEETDQGPLPKIDDAGREPWRVYARPFRKVDETPRIAIVMTQLGLSPQLTQQAITELPAPVTLGFAPYARSLADWIRQARDNGHEVIIGLPMEPSDYPRNDPGPNGLMLANSAEENTKRLNWVLSRATGYVGVFNFMGSRFTADKRALQPVLQQLKGRGLMLLDMRATPYSVMGTTAKELGIPYTAIDLIGDSEPNRGFIDDQLEALVGMAAKNKQAVAVLRPFPITMLRLKRWIGRLDPKQAVLVPLSSIAAVARPKS
jgi:polysaccharide deacetylase 2 family uncharacterized protein YibQ